MTRTFDDCIFSVRKSLLLACIAYARSLHQGVAMVKEFLALTTQGPSSAIGKPLRSGYELFRALEKTTDKQVVESSLDLEVSEQVTFALY